MPLTKEQFVALRNKGLTVEQIASFEKRSATATQPVEKNDGILKSLARSIAKPFYQAGEIINEGGKTLGAVAKAGSQLLIGKKDAGKQTLVNEAKRVSEARSKPLMVLGQDVGRAQNAKQAMGIGADVASNFIGGAGAIKTFGEGFAKQTLKTALKAGIKEGALTGAKAGLVSGAGQALENGKNVLVGALKGGATGAVAGATLGGVATGATRLLSSGIKNKAINEMVDYVSPRITNKEKPGLMAAERLTPQTLLKSEKYIPSKFDKEVAQTALQVKLTKNPGKDVPKVKEAITQFADHLKGFLKDTGAIWNRNTIVRRLRDAGKSDSMRIVLRGKEDKAVYDNIVNIIDRELQKLKGGSLDQLLDVRKKVDEAANRVDPNFWSKKDTPLYHAVKNARDVLNNYINEKAGNDVVKESLKRQSHLYTILENVSEKATLGKSKLAPSTVGGLLKRNAKQITTGVVSAAGTLLGAKIISKKN